MNDLKTHEAALGVLDLALLIIRRQIKEFEQGAERVSAIRYRRDALVEREQALQASILVLREDSGE